MNRGFYALPVILAGMLMTLALAAVHIYISNVDLYLTLDAVQEQGYLLIPNHVIMQGLLDIGPALSGAVMFMLSVGAALSSFTFAAVWLWDRLFCRSIIVLILLMIVWAGVVFTANSHGFSFFVTCYFLLVPAVTAVACMKRMPVQSGRTVRRNKIVHICSFIVISLLCISQLSGSIFVDFRDNFFLSNPVGIKMNDFYYKYTLYAAEVIKPLDQKSIKTASLQGFNSDSDVRMLKLALHKYNYLTMDENASVHLKIIQEGSELVFDHGGDEVLRTTVKDFLTGPANVLLDFSMKTDRMAFFRTFIFLSLLAGLPLSVYIGLYSLFRLVSSFMMNATASAITSAVICLLIGASLVFTLESNKEGKVGVDDLTAALESDRWQTRMAALKVIEKNGLEVSSYGAYKGMLESPYVAERYWLARALGVSNRPETLKDITAFLDDPHTNVVCMAYSALGKRADSSFIKEIIFRLELSDRWYEQLYAYNALMELGWRQKLSN
jgi:hypothetical protein